MNTTNQELKLKLSLLLDDELSPTDQHEVLDRIADEPKLRSAWARYNLIGEVIRAEQGIFAGDDFARRISQAVAQEPAPARVLSERALPERVVLTERVLSERSVQSSPKSARKPSLFNRRAGFAWAAALVGFAVVMGYSATNPDLSRIDLALQQHDTSTDQSQEALADARINDYLMTHNEVSYLVGSTSMLPHARLVSSPER
jgi:sigma-E factor negative regulatory protein RseA